MRKLIKKTIGSLLCVIMIMAFLPLSAMAENNEVVIDNNGMTITVPKGGSVALVPKGADADPTGTTYEWMRFTDRGFGDYNRDMDWSANTARLELTNVTEDCRFQCNITPTTGAPRYATVNIVIPKEENHLQIKASDTPVGETDGKVMVPAGETAHISVQVTADNLEGLTYKWGRKPIDRTYSPIIPYVTIIPDENSNSLDIKNVQIFENYYCEVTDKFGNKAQATFYVGVDNNLCFTDLQDEPFLTELKGQVGEEITVCANVSATETDGMSYKWTVQDNSTYMVQEFTTEDLVFTVSKPSTISLTVIDKYNNMIMRYYNLKLDDGLKPNIQVSITETDIEADRVFNTGGYGSLTINSTYNVQTGDFMSSPKAALVDYNGQLVFPYKDTWLTYTYSDGVVSLTADDLYEYFIHYPNNNNYDMPGFYYLDGTEVFQNNYLCVSPMIDGYAIVNLETEQPSMDGEYCLINKEGEVKYTFEDSFNNLRGFGFGYANVFFSAESMLRWPSEDLIVFSTYGEWDYYSYPCISMGWKNLKGETIFTSDEYNYCYNFHEDLIGIANIETGKWGYLNKEGEEVIPCQFDSASSFIDGFAYASLNGKYGYIDKSGDTVIPFEYDDAYGAGSGLFSVVKDGKCGLVDSNNTIVVPLEYDDISSIENNAAYAIKDGKLTIINVIESDNDIEVGETKEKEVNAGETEYLKFTPSVAGVYVIESDPSVYPNLQICDETKKVLESDNNYERLRKYLEEGKTYYISFENPRLVGSSTANISLNIDESCDWIIEKETSTCYVDLGSKAELVLPIKGNTDNLTFVWSKFVEDEEYPGGLTSEQIEGASNSTYVTDEINYFTKYACFVEDDKGNFQSTFFDVHVNPAWTVDLSEKTIDVSVKIGDTLDFNVPISGDTTGLTYQWMVQGYQGYMYYGEIQGANSNSYSTTANEYDRKYILVINDNYGNTERIEYNINIVTEKHELVKMDAKSPTMTSAGNIECYFCKDCNKHFKDANGLEELDESEWAIPALGASAIDDIANDVTLEVGDVKSALSKKFGESNINESIKELLTSKNTETSEKTKEALAKLEDKFDVEKVIENPSGQDLVKVENAIGMALNDACKLTVESTNKETFELIKEQQDLKNVDIENGIPFSMELKNSKDESITELDIPMVIKLKIPEGVSTNDLRVIQIHGDETIIHVPQITMEEETLYATIVVTGFSDFMLANALPVQYIKGDVNNDGNIDANDITALARHAAKISTIIDVNILSNCCDVDGDGSVGASDVTKLARYVAKIIDKL